jgi:PIN domain nuclease of toxin-antitoxin system
MTSPAQTPFYVTDTHALFWYLTASPKLSPAARQAFREAEQGRAKILVPVIVLAELYFLNEKAGQPLDFPAEYQRMTTSGMLKFVPLEADLILLFPQLAAIPEMHDRMIAAVAYRAGAPLITKDDVLRQSGVVQIRW